jgi:hypothetical protein
MVKTDGITVVKMSFVGFALVNAGATVGTVTFPDINGYLEARRRVNKGGTAKFSPLTCSDMSRGRFFV